MLLGRASECARLGSLLADSAQGPGGAPTLMTGSRRVGRASRPRQRHDTRIGIGSRSLPASGSFQSARFFSANAAALRDETSAKACVSVIG
jgi:hypothetical protein